jgi:hypothetical protein
MGLAGRLYQRTDISVQTRMTKAMIEEIARAATPTAKYIGKWRTKNICGMN